MAVLGLRFVTSRLISQSRICLKKNDTPVVSKSQAVEEPGPLKGARTPVGPERESLPDIPEYQHLERPTLWEPVASPYGRNIAADYNPQIVAPDPVNIVSSTWFYLKNIHRAHFYCDYTKQWYFMKDPLTGGWLLYERFVLFFIYIPIFLYFLHIVYEDLRYKYTPWIQRIRRGRAASRDAVRQDIERALALADYDATAR